MPSSSRKGRLSSRSSVPSLRSMSSVSSMSSSPSSSPRSSPQFARSPKSTGSIPTVTPVRSMEGEEAAGGRGERRSREDEDEGVRPAVAMDVVGFDGLERQRGPIRPEDGRLVFQFTPFGLVRQPPPAPPRDSPFSSPESSCRLRQSIFRRRTSGGESSSSSPPQLSSVAARAASAALSASFEMERDDISRTTLWPLRRRSDGPRLVTLITGRGAGANKRPRVDGTPPRKGRDNELPFPTTPHTMPLLEEHALLQSPPLSVAQRACHSSASIPWYAQSLDETPHTPSLPNDGEAGVTGHSQPDLPTPPPPPPSCPAEDAALDASIHRRVCDLFQEGKPKRPGVRPSCKTAEDSHATPVSPQPTTMHPVETPTRLTAASVGVDLGRSLLAGGGDRDTSSLLLASGDLCLAQQGIPQVSPLGSLAAIAVARGGEGAARLSQSTSDLHSGKSSQQSAHEEPFDDREFGLQPSDCTPRDKVVRSASLPTLPQCVSEHGSQQRLKSRPAVDAMKALSGECVSPNRRRLHSASRGGCANKPTDATRLVADAAMPCADGDEGSKSSKLANDSATAGSGISARAETTT